MKKHITILYLVFLNLLCNSTYAANGEEGAISSKSIYFIALAITVCLGTFSQSRTATHALDGIARNPSAGNKIQTTLILSLALIETLVIFMLISTFLAT